MTETVGGYFIDYRQLLKEDTKTILVELDPLLVISDYKNRSCLSPWLWADYELQRRIGTIISSHIHREANSDF